MKVTKGKITGRTVECGGQEPQSRGEQRGESVCPSSSPFWPLNGLRQGLEAVHLLWIHITDQNRVKQIENLHSVALHIQRFEGR